MKRRIGAAVAALIAATASATLVACGTNQPVYDAICVNRGSHQRVVEGQCTRSSMTYVFYYISPGENVPQIGGYAKSGTTAKPKGAVIQKAPAKGTSVRRPGRVA